jgi:hypothetical protein
MKGWKGKNSTAGMPQSVQDDYSNAQSEVTKEYSVPVDSFIAKKDFEIHHNDYHRVIKAGDDVSDVPEHYHPNLRAEGVL